MPATSQIAQTAPVWPTRPVAPRGQIETTLTNVSNTAELAGNRSTAPLSPDPALIQNRFGNASLRHQPIGSNSTPTSSASGTANGPAGSVDADASSVTGNAEALSTSETRASSAVSARHRTAVKAKLGHLAKSLEKRARDAEQSFKMRELCTCEQLGKLGVSEDVISLLVTSPSGYGAELVVDACRVLSLDPVIDGEHAAEAQEVKEALTAYIRKAGRDFSGTAPNGSNAYKTKETLKEKLMALTDRIGYEAISANLQRDIAPAVNAVLLRKGHPVDNKSLEKALNEAAFGALEGMIEGDVFSLLHLMDELPKLLEPAHPDEGKRPTRDTGAPARPQDQPAAPGPAATPSASPYIVNNFSPHISAGNGSHTLQTPVTVTYPGDLGNQGSGHADGGSASKVPLVQEFGTDMRQRPVVNQSGHDQLMGEDSSILGHPVDGMSGPRSGDPVISQANMGSAMNPASDDPDNRTVVGVRPSPSEPVLVTLDRDAEASGTEDDASVAPHPMDNRPNPFKGHVKTLAATFEGLPATHVPTAKHLLTGHSWLNDKNPGMLGSVPKGGGPRFTLNHRTVRDNVPNPNGAATVPSRVHVRNVKPQSKTVEARAVEMEAYREPPSVQSNHRGLGDQPEQHKVRVMPRSND